MCASMTKNQARTAPIVTLRGISGSGKTTYVKSNLPDYTVVSRDEIRSRFCDLNEYFDGGMRGPFEEYITTIEEQEIAKAICKNQPLVIDNTNLRKRYFQNYINIFAQLNVDPSVVKLVELSCDPSTAARRNELCGKHISKDVVMQQYRQFVSSRFKMEDFIQDGNWISTKEKSYFFIPDEVERYVPDTSKPKAFIVDLDGTIAHRTVGPDMRSFYDYEDVFSDEPDPFIKEIVVALKNAGVTPIFLSGRPQQEAIDGTMQFLCQKIGIGEWDLYMRDDTVDMDGENRIADYKVKYRIFNEYIRDVYNVIGAFDDRRQIVSLWEEMGIKCLICSSSNEFGSY